MKKFLALLLSAIMCLSLAACGGNGGDSQTGGDQKTPETQTGGDTDDTGSTGGSATKVKVGLICIGDENDQGYTYNFIRGKDAATEALSAKGIDVEWVVKWNVAENDGCTDANIELAEEGCDLIINNSFGF